MKLLLPLSIILFAVLGCVQPERRGYNATQQASPSISSPTPHDASPQLELVSSRGENVSDTISTVNGQVRNVSNVDFEYLKVIVTIYDSNNQFLQSDYAFADLNPLRPGQTSTFKIHMMNVSGRFNYQLTFADQIGGQINFVDSSKQKKR